MLTHLRFASTILVGLLIGAIYHDAGNDASKTFNNGGNLFFGLLFIVFSSMMTTVLTCKYFSEINPPGSIELEEKKSKVFHYILKVKIYVSA